MIVRAVHMRSVNCSILTSTGLGLLIYLHHKRNTLCPELSLRTPSSSSATPRRHRRDRPRVRAAYVIYGRTLSLSSPCPFRAGPRRLRSSRACTSGSTAGATAHAPQQTLKRACSVLGAPRPDRTALNHAQDGIVAGAGAGLRTRRRRRRARTGHDREKDKPKSNRKVIMLSVLLHVSIILYKLPRLPSWRSARIPCSSSICRSSPPSTSSRWRSASSAASAPRTAPHTFRALAAKDKPEEPDVSAKASAKAGGSSSEESLDVGEDGPVKGKVFSRADAAYQHMCGAIENLVVHGRCAPSSPLSRRAA